MPQCYQSIVIQAPIKKVWGTVRNFHNLSWGAKVITQCMPVGELIKFTFLNINNSIFR